MSNRGRIAVPLCQTCKYHHCADDSPWVSVADSWKVYGECKMADLHSAHYAAISDTVHTERVFYELTRTRASTRSKRVQCTPEFEEAIKVKRARRDMLLSIIRQRWQKEEEENPEEEDSS
jgi:hypothetical protein